MSDAKQQLIATERAIKDGLNVRQTEGLIAKLQARGGRITSETANTKAIVPVNSNIGRLEEKLREKFGTKVRLKYVHGKGAVEISFFSDDELQRLLEILNLSAD